jgi:L-alanine-DL-glutamate epimerase-like enolase superfamily enzyme
MNAAIARIETFAINYPVIGRFKFFENRQGRPSGRPAVIVKITADDGSVGWGQSVPTPRWSYETLESVQSTIDRYLAPELIGQDVFDHERIASLMNQAIAGSFSIGQPICKAGVELALEDLAGKLLGQSAAARWGRTDGRTHIELSWTLNPRSLEELETSVATAHARGYRHFNLKVAPDAAFDLLACRRLKELAGEGHVWVDANGGYDQQTALQIAPRLANLGIAAFEQPLPANRLGGYRRLKQQAALPILMDEGIVSSVELAEFIALELLDGVAVKVSRSGGLAESWRIVELLEQHGLLFYASGLTDPDLSLAASLILFGAGKLAVPAALNGPQFLQTSILAAPLAAENGRIAVPTGPGLGVEVCPQALREHLLPS